MPKSRWGSTGQASGQESFLSFVLCHYGIQLVEVGSHCRGCLGRGAGAGADKGPKYTLFVLVTNGWRKLDLNISAGDSLLPWPLGFWPLGSWGLVHRWSLGWESHLDMWEEVGS